jgi:MFS family permease
LHRFLSPLAPFRNRGFLGYWLTGLSANLGWQIQLVGASWLMVEMGGSAQQVALVQTAVALPVMLMSLPGGVMADLVGQRKLIIWAQSFLLVVSFGLAAAAYFQALTPALLLACTFLIGSGRALYYPGWQSMVFEFFSRENVGPALAINSSNLNIARSVGPAIGGAIVAASGAFVAFVINGICNLTVILVARRWPKVTATDGLPPESFGNAIMAGLRYMSLSPTLIAVTLRSFVFNIAAISAMALLPLVARDLIGGGPTTLGVMLGSFGVGAIFGSFVTDALRTKVPLERIFAGAHVGFAIATAVLALSSSLAVSLLAGMLGGFCWIITQVLYNYLVQVQSPRWVISRMISIYLTFVFGGNAIGSFVWGWLADSRSTPDSLLVSAAVCAASALLALSFRIREPSASGLAPHGTWTPPQPAIDLVARSGPIMTSITYRIRDENTGAFLDAMREKRRNRIRDGGTRWTLSRDILDPMIWTERFKVATWADAQRLHARRTVAGALVNETVRKLHDGAEAPEVHYELIRQPGQSTSFGGFLPHRTP